MKTFVPSSNLKNSLLLLAIASLLSFSSSAQTYTTKANGTWNKSSTWQGGSVPPNNGSITSGMVINIKHIVTYTGSNITNLGTININNPGGASPRLIIGSGISFENKNTGKLYINNGELRQYRFAGGGETGTSQKGSFKNNKGYVSIKNSFVEIAEDWTNEGGTVLFNNCSLAIGGGYDVKDNSTDSLLYTSISVGMQGSGDFSIDGGNTNAYFQSLRAEIASTKGKFDLKKGNVNGSIEYITLKNHVSNTFSSDKISASTNILTTGLSLKAYCVRTSSDYQPNGKFSGSQTLDCSFSYFPANLFGGTSTSNLNFSAAPVLISGTDKKLGAQYKYESVAPGLDAIVKIDSVVGGAVVNTLDDNSGAGYIEGFQPQITSGRIIGNSYVVFTFNFKITGTSVDNTLDTVSLTALDIDGNSTLKEFDQISLGAGATAAYVGANPSISLTNTSPGSFLGINADGIERSSVDTSAKQNMFTVTNTGISTFKVRLGIFNTKLSQDLRLFSVYMKGFSYPNLTVLPVKMESFTAMLDKDGKKVQLNWVTTNEINVNHFVVERSLDGTHFTNTGMVFSAGNSSQRVNYSFPDGIISVQANMIYYRLCTVDIDGRMQYSDVRIIRLTKQSNNDLSIFTYPNPVASELRITIPTSWQNKQVSYEIFNVRGQLSKRIVEKASSQTEAVNVSNLTDGMYVVKVSCEGQSVIQKIIKNQN